MSFLLIIENITEILKITCRNDMVISSKLVDCGMLIISEQKATVGVIRCLLWTTYVSNQSQTKLPHRAIHLGRSRLCGQNHPNVFDRQLLAALHEQTGTFKSSGRHLQPMVWAHSRCSEIWLANSGKSRNNEEIIGNGRAGEGGRRVWG